jgi:hypothetical protein
MIPSHLARHPRPEPTESLPGYVLRLTQVNGCSSPRELFRLAGMKANETSFTKFACSKFAFIANLPTSDLERIAFTHPEKDPDAMYLLKNRVSAKDRNLSGARVYPDCVKEKGFIEAHWHIALMVACPIHETAAVWFCGQCRSRLHWLRPGLLECKCGTPLLNRPRDRYSDPELALLDLICQKALGEEICYRRDPSMPVRQLEAMNLQSLLSLVRFLGAKGLTASWSSKPQLGQHLLRKTANVLTNWPVNFETFLKGICPLASDEGASTLSEDFANIYEVVDGRMTARFQRRGSCQNTTFRSGAYPSATSSPTHLAEEARCSELKASEGGEIRNHQDGMNRDARQSNAATPHSG